MTNGTRWGWGVSVTPRPLFAPGKDSVPIVQEAGWAPGPVWTGVENLAPTGIRSPDRPARSQSLYRLSYPAHTCKYMGRCKRTQKNPHCAKLDISRDGVYPYLKKEVVSCYETLWPSVSQSQDITSQLTASFRILGGLKEFRTDNKTVFPGLSSDELSLVCRTETARTWTALQRAWVNVVRNPTRSFETEHEPPDKFRVVIRWHLSPRRVLHVQRNCS